MSDIIYSIKSHPDWENFEKTLLDRRPIIPDFDPNKGNIERWKYESGRRAGYDLVLTLLKIEV